MQRRLPPLLVPRKASLGRRCIHEKMEKERED